MEVIEDQDFLLNIPHDLHEEDWRELYAMYKTLPGWIGMETNGVSYWFGKENDEQYIKASVGFEGLKVEICLPEDLWKPWIVLYLKKARLALGYEVKIIA